MALRLPVIAERIAAHAALRRRWHHRAAALARRSVVYRVRGRRRSSRPRTKRVAMGNAGRARAQRDFAEDGDDRRVRARRERRRRPGEVGDEVSRGRSVDATDVRAPRGVRGDCAARSRRSSGSASRAPVDRRADRRLGLLAARHPARGRRAAARAPHSPSVTRDEIERIARAAYAHLGRTSVETAILPSYIADRDHRAVRGGERLGASSRSGSRSARDSSSSRDISATGSSGARTSPRAACRSTRSPGTWPTRCSIDISRARVSESG